jgi:hypothetical protein
MIAESFDLVKKGHPVESSVFPQLIDTVALIFGDAKRRCCRKQATARWVPDMSDHFAHLTDLIRRPGRCAFEAYTETRAIYFNSQS